uniref:Putative secreted protein n=1 Tax=Anopheles marajoara TaxID=58244 RepID=A0A2M4CCF3_9DIPT
MVCHVATCTFPEQRVTITFWLLLCHTCCVRSVPFPADGGTTLAQHLRTWRASMDVLETSQCEGSIHFVENDFPLRV